MAKNELVVTGVDQFGKMLRIKIVLAPKIGEIGEIVGIEIMNSEEFEGYMKDLEKLLKK